MVSPSTTGIVNQTIQNLINSPMAPTLSLPPSSATPPLEPNSILFDEYTADSLALIYGPQRDPLYVVIPISLIYLLIFVTGVIGNISTCIVIARNRSMHTATNYYLFSLAISDLCLLLSGAPQEVYQMWWKYPYIFGEAFCVGRGLMAETSANATVLTITSFTVERYLAICHPFLQHTMSKLSRAVRLILVVWVVSLLLAMPMALQFGVQTNVHGLAYCGVKRIFVEHIFELSTGVMFIAPMTIITILYVLIGLKLRSSCLMKQENALQRGAHVNSCGQTSSGTRRVIKMLVAVVVAFFLCWAPFHTQRLIAFYGNDQPVLYAIITYTSGVLYYLSTCINPLLYNLMSNKFRQAFKDTLAKCCRLPKRRKKCAYRTLSRGQRRRFTHQESADYSGSSFRDDSLYSTTTQKQSFDSMTLSRTQSIRVSHSILKGAQQASCTSSTAVDGISTLPSPLSSSTTALATLATGGIGPGPTAYHRSVSMERDNNNHPIHGSLLLTAMRNSRHSIGRQLSRDGASIGASSQQHPAYDDCVVVNNITSSMGAVVVAAENVIKSKSTTKQRINAELADKRPLDNDRNSGTSTNTSGAAGSGGAGGGGVNNCDGRSSNDTSQTAPECINVKYKRKEEIKISIRPSTARMRRRRQPTTRLWHFIGGLFGWRRTGGSRSREHNSHSSAHETSGSGSGSGSGRSKRPLNRSDAISLEDEDDDDISNSSLKDVDTAALEDELSSYMEELRNNGHHGRDLIGRTQLK